jgi:hypothetical protein
MHTCIHTYIEFIKNTSADLFTLLLRCCHCCWAAAAELLMLSCELLLLRALPSSCEQVLKKAQKYVTSRLFYMSILIFGRHKYCRPLRNPIGETSTVADFRVRPLFFIACLNSFLGDFRDAILRFMRGGQPAGP